MASNPMQRSYAGLTQAYEHFNTALFDGNLPPCLITLQRRGRSYGYFAAGRFVGVDSPGETAAANRNNAIDEIALNPAHFSLRPAADVFATLAHDMTHLWQHHFGKASRPGYHNREWAAKMRGIGFLATDGIPTGQKVRYAVEAGGAFERACRAFLANGGALVYQDRVRKGEEADGSSKAGKRTRYTCPCCRLNVWAKPEVMLICGKCRQALEAAPCDPTAFAQGGNLVSI